MTIPETTWQDKIGKIVQVRRAAGCMQGPRDALCDKLSHNIQGGAPPDINGL